MLRRPEHHQTRSPCERKPGRPVRTRQRRGHPRITERVGEPSPELPDIPRAGDIRCERSPSERLVGVDDLACLYGTPAVLEELMEVLHPPGKLGPAEVAPRIPVL